MKLPTKLYHYSPREIDKLNPDFYEKYKHHWPEFGAMKPCGLWVSIEEEDSDTTWFDWCKSEYFRVENLRHKYLVTLDSNTKILHLKNPEEIKQFSIDYAANDPLDFSRRMGGRKPYVYMINWGEVKAKYDGIFISPYQWDCRFCSVANWYYPWDCSSGCIWNLEKISLKLESLIDTDSLKEPESQEEENAKDLQWASLGQST